MAIPVTATNSPAASRAKTQPGTGFPPGALISRVSLTGQTATQR